MAKKRLPPPGDDYDWVVGEFRKIIKHVNSETKDPVGTIFSLAGALVAGLAKTQDVDPYRVAAALAENAEIILNSGGEIPPPREGMH